jgi:hypothetical protein
VFLAAATSAAMEVMAVMARQSSFLSLGLLVTEQ